MKPILIALPGNDAIAGALGRHLDVEPGDLLVRHFPDDETYVRLLTPVADRRVALACTLDRPDRKLAPLLFAAAAARDLGASEVGLVAPYLCYMRQDARFHEGEGITARYFPEWISGHFDWLVTVDPHLHRIGRLEEVYRCATQVVPAAPAIAEWIRSNVESPIVIGPDAESVQWVSDVAARIGAPATTLVKIRHGDRDVEVSVPDAAMLRGHTPVLVDDIVSTAATMAAALTHLRGLATPPPVCVAVHPVLAGEAESRLERAGAHRFVSCNTIVHSSNRIELSGALAGALIDRFGFSPSP